MKYISFYCKKANNPVTMFYDPRSSFDITSFYCTCTKCVKPYKNCWEKNCETSRIIMKISRGTVPLVREEKT
jgi:hypothetical protein